MVKKVSKAQAPAEKAVEKESGKKEESKKVQKSADVDMEQSGSAKEQAASNIDSGDIEDTMTVKEKKENALKFAKAVKKMNAKIKKAIEKKQIIKAVQALQAYQKKVRAEGAKSHKNLLEEEDQFIQLGFTLTQLPERPTPRPLEIKVPHPFQGDAKEHGTKVCVFAKDPASDLKSQLSELKVPCIAKVIPFSKLKKEFKQYKDKRQLLQDYDLFLSDIRVYKMLPEVLGKEFYQKKKYPCPIKLHGFSDPKELQKQLNKAAKATYYIQGNGPNYSLRVGRSSQEAAQVAENVENALSYALGYTTYHDDIKFSSVQSVSVKIGESPELPIFNQLQQSEILAYIASDAK